MLYHHVKNMRRFLPFVLAMIALTASEISAQNQRLTPELLWKIGRASLDCVSPDGRSAVYGVQRYDLKTNKSSRILYLVDLGSGDTRALTTEADGAASDAEFHPDGKKLGFLKDGKLHEVTLATGAITKASDLEINGFHYSPDGKKVLFARDVQLDQSAADANPDLPNTSGRIMDGLFYRHWKSWRDYTYSHIFWVNYDNGAFAGDPVDLMLNEKFDSPLKPMGGMEQVTWTRDNRFIVYTSRKLNGTAEAQSTNSDLYLYELASGKTLNITEGMPGYDMDPVFSPDGRYLAWTSMARPGNEADRTRIMILDTQTNFRDELTVDWKYEANHPHWAADGKSLYFLSANDFTYQICQVGLTDKKIRRITTGQHDYTALEVAGNQIIASRNSMSAPAEIYSVNPQNGASRQLSFVTRDPWDGIAKAKVERHTVRTTDGKDMNTWVILPPDFDPNKKYPALLYCQGGPQSPLSQFFSYRWNFQLMAANGYVVIAPCRRGMPGGPEGQAWNDAISGDWGGQVMQDLLSATDYGAQLPYVDANRMGAVGASFGGYSVYWLAGNHQKRFKAFIAHCGMFNTTSWWGTTEEMWFAKHDLDENYWEAPNDPAWTKFSPHQYVQNWDTPLLVIHNELDFRVPLSEGMQAFQAAQMRGIPSKFLYFPDEGHWVTKAQNSILWQRTFFDWLDTYLKQP